MTLEREEQYRETASKGKYSRLLAHISKLDGQEWRTSFGEVESILGFRLPKSARLHRPWWANENPGRSHTHALAWMSAGWKTAEVDLGAETLVFRRVKAGLERRISGGVPDLEWDWPVHRAGGWPEGLTLSRVEIYDATPGTPDVR